MEDKNYINEELLQISPTLAKLEKKNAYQVASAYFTELPLLVLDKIRSGAEPSYYFTRDIPFSVPENYFETLANDIMLKVLPIKRNEVFEETEQISPLLNRISKQPVYSVPDYYFSEKKEALVASVNQDRTEVKVVKLKRTNFSKYAAAAVVAFLLGIGGFFLTGKNNNALQAKKDNANVQVNKLSEDEIIEFLKTTAPVEDATTLYKSSEREKNMRTSVSKMSDKEIKDFLKENGEAEDI